MNNMKKESSTTPVEELHFANLRSVNERLTRMFSGESTNDYRTIKLLVFVNFVYVRLHEYPALYSYIISQFDFYNNIIKSGYIVAFSPEITTNDLVRLAASYYLGEYAEDDYLEWQYNMVGSIIHQIHTIIKENEKVVMMQEMIGEFVAMPKLLEARTFPETLLLTCWAKNTKCLSDLGNIVYSYSFMPHKNETVFKELTAIIDKNLSSLKDDEHPLIIQQLHKTINRISENVEEPIKKWIRLHAFYWMTSVGWLDDPEYLNEVIKSQKVTELAMDECLKKLYIVAHESTESPRYEFIRGIFLYLLREESKKDK